MVLTCFTLLMPAFSLLPAPVVLPDCLHRRQNAPLPLHSLLCVPGFGAVLQPRYIIRAKAFDQ